MKLFLLSLLFLVSCTSTGFQNDSKWGIQLQGYNGKHNISRIKNSNVDLWVIDYSRDGSDEMKFTKKEISDLKKGSKTILSYLSIGEAEEFRYYYKEMPKTLLLGSNPKWPDNHYVKYWDKRWQEIIISAPNQAMTSYLDRIMTQGFNGVYLDIVDAF